MALGMEGRPRNLIFNNIAKKITILRNPAIHQELLLSMDNFINLKKVYFSREILENPEVRELVVNHLCS